MDSLSDDEGSAGRGHITNYAQNVNGTVWNLAMLKQHLGECWQPQHSLSITAVYDQAACASLVVVEQLALVSFNDCQACKLLLLLQAVKYINSYGVNL